MKNFAIVAAFLLLTGTVLSQELAMTNLKVVEGPNILWENQTIDFGVLKKGEPATTSFVFTNNGSSEVVIERVKTSCGCTASDYPKEPIAPGESASITATYNAKSIGSFSKTITVYSNAIETVSTLRIKGTVN